MLPPLLSQGNVKPIKTFYHKIILLATYYICILFWAISYGNFKRNSRYRGAKIAHRERLYLNIELSLSLAIQRMRDGIKERNSKEDYPARMPKRKTHTDKQINAGYKHGIIQGGEPL